MVDTTRTIAMWQEFAVGSARMTVFSEPSLSHDGFTVLRSVLDEPALETLATSFSHHEQAQIPRSAQVLFVHTPPPPDTPPFDDIMLQWLNPNKRALPLSTFPLAALVRPIIEGLLGEPVVLFQDLLLDKGESQRNRFAWS